MARLTPGPGKKISKKKPAKSPGSAVISGFKKMGEAVKNATSSKKLRKGTSGEAAGVVSRTGGVINLSESRVKGSRQAGIESLKKKRKSGEMSRQEASAKIKALKQGGKKKTEYEFKGGRIQTIRGMKQGSLQKLPSMDSTTFMNLARTSDPYSKTVTTPNGNVYGTFSKTVKGPAKNMYEDLKSAMARDAKKNPGAKFSDFKLDPKTGSYMYKYSTPKKK